METTTRRELAPRYEPASVEPVIYERWLGANAFTPAPEPPAGAERFVIIQPPPNVTGALHLGHAARATVEDTLIRYHRMRGDDTLWLPGVDHASIAAQFVLDRILAEEGETQQSLGRERYLERMWRFMEDTRGIIGMQHRRIGASADWSRERFTMDAGSARAVRVAFRRLWDAGLAYRGEALVNWCPRCRTTISDLENVHREEPGSLWTIRYHLAREDGLPDPEATISVATTRPETILGDVAVAVHPDDARYRSLVGRSAVLPFLHRTLPIIADEAVDPEFGTGAVKITPAHDPADYELGRRHGLPAISVLDDDARINAAGGEFAGLDRFDARRAIVERLREAGDLVDARPHTLVIGRCDRCDTIVESRLSVQWFVRVKTLADRALASVRDGRTRVVPAHFEKDYANWMENIHDWAVGRQLWWGHRIPAWHCVDGHITVTEADGGPDACAECGRPAGELTQETDTFDTWFSSGLWPFSSLGWPEDTPDLRRFYPTSVLETAYDILFFWVARMMMLGLFLTDTEPFKVVLLSGMIRDPYGQKMSKTRGNVIDPLGMIDEIGADALRFALVAGTAPGGDQRLTPAKLEGGRNFTNKLWNAGRFVLGARLPGADAPRGEPGLAERWISSRLAEATKRATAQLDGLDLSGYVATVHEFAWSDYCDWFLEIAKVDLRDPGLPAGDRVRIWRCAAETLGGLLRLLHPIMPFVSEALWRPLGEALPSATVGEPLLITARWPVARGSDAQADAAMAGVLELVRDLRDQRTRQAIPPAEWREASVLAGGGDAAEVLRSTARHIEALARVRPFGILDSSAGGPPPHASNSRLGASWLAAPADVGAATERARRRAGELDTQIDRVRRLLANSSFTERAPAGVVDAERRRLADLEDQRRLLSDGA